MSTTESSTIEKIWTNLGRLDMRILAGDEELRRKYDLTGKMTPVDSLTEFFKDEFGKDYSSGLNKRKLQDRLRLLSMYHLIEIRCGDDELVKEFCVKSDGTYILAAEKNKLMLEHLKSHSPNV